MMPINNDGGITAGTNPLVTEEAPINPLVREENTTASDDRRRSQMKATFAANGALDSPDRDQLHSVDFKMQARNQPGSNTLNKDMIHSLNEQSIGTAHLRGDMHT